MSEPGEIKKKVGVGFGVMLLRDGKILLGKRHGDPQKGGGSLNGEGKWSMPGGKLEFGEPILADPEEYTEWNWFDLNELPEPLFFPSERELNNYMKKKFYISR